MPSAESGPTSTSSGVVGVSVPWTGSLIVFSPSPVGSSTVEGGFTNSISA